MSKKIKILRIIARLNIGGPAIHTILLAEGLDEDKFETILITGMPEENEGDMLYLAKEKNVQPIIIQELGRYLGIYRDFVAFWKLFCLIKKEKPDIIHTHTAKAGTLGRLAGLLYNGYSMLYALCSMRTCRRCKIVHTFHGHVLCGYFNGTKNTIYTWIERVLALFTDKIITVSESLKKELVISKIANADKIVTIPLGLELDKFLRIEDNRSGSRNYKSIGIIGRLVPIKNHTMFLDVAKRLKENWSFEQEVRFLIIGDGSLRLQLESYAKRLDIERDVIFTGWKRNIEEIYDEIDVVALTSLNEGTPVALIEAQAAGRPCVATRVGGVSDVVEDGKSGFLVSSGDVKTFTECLIKLLVDPSLRERMGNYARSKVKDKFNSHHLIKDIGVLYAELTA